MKRKLIALSTMIFAFFFLTCTGIGQAQDFIKGFSLKFTGGYGTMATGDFNTIGQDFERYQDDRIPFLEYLFSSQVSRTGEFKKINMGLEFEGELIMDLGRTFGIGFGVGYIRRSNESEIGFSIAGWDPTKEYSDSIEPIITVFPVNLSLYFFPPITPSRNIYLYGGFGYYMSKITCNNKHTRDKWDGTWTNYELEAKDEGLGFHAGAGLEFNIAPKIDIFIETKGRYCKLESWEGKNVYTNNRGGTYSTTGTMWFCESLDEDTGKWYSEYQFLEEKPPWRSIQYIKKFAVNLTGISLRAGIRIKF